MYEIHNQTTIKQGIEQFSAGASLVVSSGLLQWDDNQHCFSAGKKGAFELHWKKFDRVYGRAAMWNIFSAGAELMLKGFLIAEEILKPEPKNVLDYPKNKNFTKLGDWSFEILKTSYQKRPMQSTFSYGTISGALTNFRHAKRIDTNARLEKIGSSTPDIFVAAAYELLRDSIRNRDTHAYVPNVRAQHEWLANGMFLHAFNTLVDYFSENNRARISKAIMESRPTS